MNKKTIQIIVDEDKKKLIESFIFEKSLIDNKQYTVSSFFSKLILDYIQKNPNKK